MKEKNIAVALEVQHVLPEELGNVNLEKFQDKFTSGILFEF